MNNSKQIRDTANSMAVALETHCCHRNQKFIELMNNYLDLIHDSNRETAFEIDQFHNDTPANVSTS